MTLEHAAGDLFQQALPALAHGCNCSGSMAGGIAVSFRALDEGMYQAYVRRCHDGTFRLGDVLPWQLADGRVVYNLATQQRPGRDARIDAIAQSVAAMLIDAEERGLDRVGVPRLGAGIGGLEWREVETALVGAAAASRVTLVVVSRGERPSRSRPPS